MANLSCKTVWIISPSLPPAICGVGAHTAKLARELAFLQPDCQWHIYTTKRSEICSSSDLFPENSSVKIFPEMSVWKGPLFWQAFENALTHDLPSVVIIQYLPHLYDRLGINMDICNAVKTLRQKNIPVYAIIHEMYVPFDRHLKHWITSPVQRHMMKELVYSVEGAFLTTAYRQKIIQKKYPNCSHKIMHLPVTSNIDLFPLSENEKDAIKSAYCSVSDEKMLLVWGMLHESKCLPWILKALKELKKNKISFQLVYVGPDQDVLENAINHNSLCHIRNQIHMVGPLSEKQVSFHLQTADLLLYPLDDGASTRRGGLMAAIQHGIPVLTTLGVSTDETLRCCPNIYFATQAGEFAKILVDLVQKPFIKDQSLSMDMQKFFTGHYSWNSIAKILLKTIPLC